ncbi:MAG: AAA family ATPase, partial [Chloroflexi bacterium]|nr:AAA family ATPase [Chloroflexota bacterium]
MTTNDDFKRRARALQLYGLLAHWDEAGGQAWVGQLIEWEEA